MKPEEILDYMQGFDLDFDNFSKFPIVQGVYPAVLYVVWRWFMGTRGKRLDGWVDDTIEIPEKITEQLKWGTPNQKYAIKIFLLDEQNKKFWEGRPPNEKFKYNDVFDYIEKIRFKNLHKHLAGTSDELNTLTHFLTLLQQHRYIYDINNSFVTELYQLLCDGSRFLRENKDFPKEILDKLNEIKHAEFLAYWHEQRKIKGISPRVANELKRISISPKTTVESFFAMLFDDFFNDMKSKGNYNICPNKYCNQIFQVGKGESKSYKKIWYCSQDCIDGSRRHGYYANHAEEIKSESKKDRKFELEMEKQSKTIEKTVINEPLQEKQSKTETQEDQLDSGQGRYI